ncbi:DNA binding domain of tn916 integrase [Lachnospiraceae bacterium KH1T2]|nr:DNA binding domain of tn916 integrase [Lachnospiraceae bacterium KH1T2]
MSEKRRDSRGRILHNGEMQMSDGTAKRPIWFSAGGCNQDSNST